MRKNTLKEKLLQNKTVLGAFVSTPSPSTVEMLGWLGMDYVVIDCEHSVTDYETAENMVRAAELSNITAIVRAGLNLQQNIQRYLDAGVQGVLIPLINNSDDAKSVVNSCKYPPIGKRGLFSTSRTGKYGITPIVDHVNTMESLIPKIIDAGKIPGTLVADGDQAKYWNDKGINFLIGGANKFLLNGSKQFIDDVKTKTKS